MSNFEYYSPPNKKIENFSNAFDILKNENIIIDAKYIEVIEAAELGYCTAWIELQSGFANGYKGLPKNYKMARYYSDIMIQETTKCPVLKKTPSLKFESLRASAYLEMDYKNYKTAISHFIRAIKVMLKMPMEKWDFQIFDNLHNLKNLIDNEALN